MHDCFGANQRWNSRARFDRHDEIIVPFIDSYEEDGTYTAEFAEKAREAARKKHDGVRVGKILLKVLGIA